ncbi:filamentous hemagglutinin [Scytonema hofmannii PCC 7110]|uniref:Filamentous hemagglutinin n=1 Tax=Scytonema hofmannii PCC 7110 TaxID=128403 RepID=A0A139XEI4_9CYAN|nr:filamentous hemagglutinin N-terminal domain-containing protein [Scytonema hofmannii]KYC43098.1 filamentous hemagglutinin [Scytonema hofmannii PCC 7110]
MSGDWYWKKKFKLVIWLALLETIMILSVKSAYAQSQSHIVPDNTLGTESSSVITNLDGSPLETIAGGARRGVNLFHSFREFNVGEGRAVYFTNPAGIENILSRVTGRNRSQILGKLGVLGNANLFLINPNGIIFGPNASLDVNGSFIATSANAIQFGEQGFFSASFPEAPPLLTINPSALFFNQIGAGSIENRSIASAGVDSASNPVVGLRVPNGQSLLLVGGDIAINAGRLNALGGRVELAGVASPGTIGLSVDDSNLALTFPNQVVRGDVSLTNGAFINVAADGGGAIALHAKNIDISGGSSLNAGIAVGLGTPETTAGDISLNATEGVSLTQSSRVINQVSEDATGNSGNINIQASSLNLTEGSDLSARTFGEGNTGNISVNVSGAVTLDGLGSNGLPSGIINLVQPLAVGNGGDINIKSESLTLTRGSILDATTLGEGNSGNILLDVRGAVTLDKANSVGLSSRISNQMGLSAVGNSGNIIIKAESLNLRQGSALNATLSGRGNSGNILIDVRGAVILEGQGGGFFSGIANQVGSSGVGNSGDINIKAESVIFEQGNELNTSTLGRGNGGNIFVDVRGAVTINADGGIFSVVRSSAIGDGGNINLKAESLKIIQSGVLNTFTLGRGNAGNISVDVKGAVIVDGNNTDFNTGIATIVTDSAIGNGGDIILKAGSLTLTQGEIAANTLGQGKGGNIEIEAANFINLTNNSEISVNSEDQGDAGDLRIQTGSLTLQGRSRLLADTVSSEGGNIQLQVRDILLLRDNSGISTTAGQQEAGGNGGNIDINTNFLVAVPSENSDITANAFEGRGGLIKISTQGIFGLKKRESLTPLSDITAFSQQNPQFNGEIVINIENPDISSELVPLPINLVDVGRLITQGCSVGRVATNKQDSQFIVTGRGGLPPQPGEALRIPAIAVHGSTIAAEKQDQSPDITTTPLVEANGWRFDEHGQVILIASTTSGSDSFGIKQRECHGS